MVTNVAISPMQLASNNVAPASEKAPEAKGFENYIVNAAPKSEEVKNPETEQKNAMQQGLESTASYMRQIQEISNNQQF